jgi:hypothetical protein
VFFGILVVEYCGLCYCFYYFYYFMLSYVECLFAAWNTCHWCHVTIWDGNNNKRLFQVNLSFNPVNLKDQLTVQGFFFEGLNGISFYTKLTKHLKREFQEYLKPSLTHPQEPMTFDRGSMPSSLGFQRDSNPNGLLAFILLKHWKK